MKTFLPRPAVILAYICVLLSGAVPTNRAEEPPPAVAPSPATPGPLHHAKITILSTMLTDRRGVGEWGFAALVESDGKRVLYDTGGRPDTGLITAR